MFAKFYEPFIWIGGLIFLYNFHNFLDTHSLLNMYMEIGLKSKHLSLFLGSIIPGLIAIFIWNHNRYINNSKHSLEILKNIIDDIKDIIESGELYNHSGYNFQRCLLLSDEFNNIFKRLELTNLDLYEIKSYHSYNISYNEKILNFYYSPLLNQIEMWRTILNDSTPIQFLTRPIISTWFKDNKYWEPHCLNFNSNEGAGIIYDCRLIRSTDEAQIVKCVEIATKILLNELNITNIILTCQRQVGWAGVSALHAGYYAHYTESPTLKVNFRNLSGFPLSEYINVVGHECRHAYQYHNKLMNRSGWIGKELEQNNIEYDSYRNSPCEIDARNFEHSYAKFIYKHPDFKECLQYLDLVIGDKETIEDRDAGIKQINSDGSPIMIFATREDTLFWLNLSQVSSRAKKWSNKLCKEVWTKHDEILYSQPFTKVMRPIMLQDFV